MSKYTFIQDDSEVGGNRVTLEFDTVSLSDVLTNFEYFLKGCSFHFDGYLDIVEDDTPEPEIKEPEKIEFNSTFHVIWDGFRRRKEEVCF